MSAVSESGLTISQKRHEYYLRNREKILAQNSARQKENRLLKTGGIKRSVGRPRRDQEEIPNVDFVKNPVGRPKKEKEEKAKNPVGRPRKTPLKTDSERNSGSSSERNS